MAEKVSIYNLMCQFVVGKSVILQCKVPFCSWSRVLFYKGKWHFAGSWCLFFSFFFSDEWQDQVNERCGNFKVWNPSPSWSYFSSRGKLRKKSISVWWKHWMTSVHHTVKTWCANFQRGDLETEDAARSGRRSAMSASETIDHVHDLILADRLISAKTITQTLEISREVAGFVIHERMGTQKLRQVGCMSLSSTRF